MEFFDTRILFFGKLKKKNCKKKGKNLDVCRDIPACAPLYALQWT